MSTLLAAAAETPFKPHFMIYSSTHVALIVEPPVGTPNLTWVNWIDRRPVRSVMRLYALGTGCMASDFAW